MCEAFQIKGLAHGVRRGSVNVRSLLLWANDIIDTYSDLHTCADQLVVSMQRYEDLDKKCFEDGRDKHPALGWKRVYITK